MRYYLSEHIKGGEAMKKKFRFIAGAVAVAFLFILSGTLALAKHAGGIPPGQAKKQGKHTYSHEQAAPSSTPPGWQHGKKTGWHGGKYPPGWSKWDKKKQSQWVGDRDHAVYEIRHLSTIYKIPSPKQNEITNAFNQAIAGGLIVNDAKDKLVNALKDENSRKGLMIDTTQSVLELLK
jgi:hypothetical protein